MSRTPSVLYAKASITQAKTVVIAAEASTKRIIRKATFHNRSGGALTIDFYCSADGTNEVRVENTRILSDKETYSVPDIEGHILEAAGTISAACSGANIDLLISGTKYT